MKERKKYICSDCLSVFEVHSTTRRLTPNCINCGDWVDVKRIEDVVRKRNHQNWTVEELKKLDECIDNNLPRLYISILLNRTIESVRKKTYRRLEERGLKNVTR